MNNPQTAIPSDWPWLPGTGSVEHPMTHGGKARLGHHCRCFRCGLTAVCGPEGDFYTTDDLGGPLFCESCMWGIAADVLALADTGLVSGRSQPRNN
jgi:hypothetical protein